MKIRNAKKEEMDFIINGIKEICKIEKEKINKETILRKKMKKEIEKRNILIAEENGPIGFIEFTFSKKTPYGIDYEDETENYCWINDMYVVKPWRKKGIGKKLIKELEKYCKNKKVNKIILDVFEINKNGQRFYDKIGFKPKVQIREMKIK